jgi:hypothetical protein
VIAYHAVETLARLRAEDIARECEMAARAAQLSRPFSPGYRERLARGLRAFARRIDPVVEPSLPPSAPIALAPSTHVHA